MVKFYVLQDKYEYKSIFVMFSISDEKIWKTGNVPESEVSREEDKGVNYGALASKPQPFQSAAEALPSNSGQKDEGASPPPPSQSAAEAESGNSGQEDQSIHNGASPPPPSQSAAEAESGNSGEEDEVINYGASASPTPSREEVEDYNARNNLRKGGIDHFC
jgi:hypothetical protein